MRKPSSTEAAHQPIESPFIPLEDAAALACSPLESVRAWIKRGLLRSYKPGRRVLIKRAELLAFIEASARGVEPPVTA